MPDPPTRDQLPSRARDRVLDVVGQTADTWTVDEVAARLGITPATARKHLDDLLRRGLVRADSERSGLPGRPRLRYRRASPAAGAGYERLAAMLLEVLRSGEAPEVVGRRLGAAHPHAPQAGPRATLLQVMDDEGFAPELTDAPHGPVMTFHRCPYASAATDQPGIVCALHRGFAAGVLGVELDDSGGADGQGAGGRIGPLEVRDPRQAGCRLHLDAAG